MKKIAFFLPATLLLIAAGPQARNPFPDQLERYKLKNGLEVIFADYGTLPVTNFTFFVNVGTKSETPGQQGLSALTATALTLGSTKYPRMEQDRILYRTGGTFTVASNENFTTITGQFLNQDVEQGMDLVSAVLLNPAFPQQDIDEEKNFTLSSNKTTKMDIGQLADMYGNYFTYGIAHPLGRHLYQAQFQKIGVPQLKEFYGFNFTPGNTKLIVTGMPDHAQVKALIEKYLGGWTAAYGEVNGSSYDIPPIKTRDYAFVPKVGATQACLEWFKRGPDAGSKDMIAFQLANGIFSDHLFKEIREKRGFTYGIGSSYSESQNDGIFRIKTQVRNNVMYATATAFDTVITDFYTKGITDAELKKVKTMRRSALLSIEEPSSFASIINPWVFKDYNKRKQYLADLDAVDLATVNKIIKKYFTPDCYHLMIAGDDTTLSDQLAKIKGLQKLDLTVIEKDQ